MKVLKKWSCNNQCKTNCCQELFLILDEKQKQSYHKTKSYFVDKSYCEWRWLSFRNAVKYKKIGKKYKLHILKQFKQKVLFNPLINKWILHIEDDCNKLMPDNRCKVYRNRPVTCQIGDCPVFSNEPKIAWLGENGMLKDVRKKLYK